MIPQRNISLISNTLLTAGGRRIPEAVIERDYVLAWFLTGLAGHPLRNILAFKAETARRNGNPRVLRLFPAKSSDSDQGDQILVRKPTGHLRPLEKV